MMKVDRVRGLIAPLVALCLVGFTAQNASAQSAVVTGKVTNEHGAAIAGAEVFIKSLNLGTSTNDAGNYTLTVPEASAHGQQVVVTSRFIGYSPTDMPVSLSAGPHTANFQLKADPFQLNAVVATGVADSTSSKNLTFSMAHVTGDQVSDVPAANPIEALAGKVAGAKISVGAGNPGASTPIRLRGSTCLQVGCSAPLVIVDGVITTEGLSDIDAQDIASIDVLKGAAGASFYGSNAANGVINITTNRGRDLAEGHVSITAHTEYGNSSIAHWPANNMGTRLTFTSAGAVALDSTGKVIRNTTGFDDDPFPTSGVNRYRNQMKTWLSNNDYYNNLVSLGLRRGNTNFASSFTSDHNGGILPFIKGQFRQNARLNVDQGLGNKADLSASVTYGNQHNDYSPGGTEGGFFGLYQAPQFIDLQHPGTTSDTTSFFPRLPDYSDPNQRGNPLYSLFTHQNTYTRQRLLGSASGRYRPTDWLRLEASYGTDRGDQQTQTYTPRGTLSSQTGNPTQGSLNDNTSHDVAWNSQFRATATKLWRSLLSTTSGAYQMEDSRSQGFSAGGSKLNVNATPDLGALDPTNISINSNFQEERTTNYMVDQSFDLKDRYIFDGLYRRDGSSLFGPNSRWSDFYRVSGAYRVTQDFHIPGVQELKLHAARGTAGLRPGFAYQYETYSVGSGQISPSTLGNKNLKPAVLTENEFGINADFLDRFSGELTYADRNTKDAFLQVPLSQALTGGFTSQWQNAATIASKTTEGSLQTRLLDRRNLTYDITLTADHTTQEITQMNRAAFRVSATGAQGQNIFWYQTGLPLGIMYGQRFVHTFAQLLDNPKNAGKVATDYVVNPLGFLVTASTRGTANEKPIQYFDKNGNGNFVIGNVNPNLNYGWVNDVRVGDFNLHAGFDGQRGGQIYNFSKQWTFQDLRSGDMDMTKVSNAGCPGVTCQKIAEGFFSTGLYNGLNPSEYFVESGAFFKLQELSAAYNVPTRYLPKVGLGRASGVKLALIGRNLLTWTSYSGFDPDITSGNDFNYKIDGFAYPPFRTITGQVEIRF